MSESPDGVKVDTDDETSYFVVDPDDYQRTKKLEMIHKAKQEVLKYRRDRPKLIEDYDGTYSGEKGIDIYRHSLAQAVAQYGSELLPLIEESVDNGILEDDDLTTQMSPEHTELDLIYFIQMDGRVKYNDKVDIPPEPNIMAMYRQLDRIQQKLGLGLEIEEDKGPAEI